MPFYPQNLSTGASPTFNNLIISTYGGLYNGVTKVFEIGSWGTPTNGLGMEAAPTGNGSTLYTTGGDTDIDLNLTTKGNGNISANADLKVTGLLFPVQASSAPAYVKGGMYFDTTLNKLRIGGATGWETVTSV
jgi:hypothetical protein